MADTQAAKPAEKVGGAERPQGAEAPSAGAAEPERPDPYAGVIGGKAPNLLAAVLLLIAIAGLIAGAAGAGSVSWVVGIGALVAAALIAGFGSRSPPPAV